MQRFPPLLPLLLVASMPALAAVPPQAPPLMFNIAAREVGLQQHGPAAILQQAVPRACDNCSVRLQLMPAVKNRVISELRKDNQALNVFAGGYSAHREKQLDRIPINLDGGLNGMRLLISRQAEAGAVASVRTLEALRQLRIGQVRDWPDAAILRENGLLVEPALNMASLLGMLQHRRFDVVLWSASEALLNEADLKRRGLQVHRHLAVCYPAGQFLHVTRQDTQRFAIIERGLRAMQQDGSLRRQQREARAAILAELGKTVSYLHLRPLLNVAGQQDPCESP